MIFNYSITPQLSRFLRVGLRLSPLGTSATVGLLYQPRMMDDDECGAVGGLIGKGNKRTSGKPAPVHFVHHKSHNT
jgi:hypothetical protein